MPQLSLYLSEITHTKIVQAAKRENKSISSCASEHLEDALTSNGCPPGYFEYWTNPENGIDIEVPPEVVIPDAPREEL